MTVLNGEMGLRAIVRDSDGETMLAFESFHLLYWGMSSLLKLLTLHGGLVSAIEVGLYPLWAETDFCILLEALK